MAFVTKSEFSDERLVAVYDTLNPYQPGTQPDFYLQVAADARAKYVLEVGCGTGLISQQFIQRGYVFVGLEPSELMLDRARRKAGTAAAQWICGDTDALDVADMDLAFMAGHVVQFFLTDAAWAGALVSIHGALRRGGILAFETRNPLAREWETWSAQQRRTATDPLAGPVSTWAEVDSVSDEVVSYALHYRFESPGIDITAPGRLRFRYLADLSRSLDNAGFEIVDVFGDWDRRPFDDESREIIVVAVRL